LPIRPNPLIPMTDFLFSNTSTRAMMHPLRI
jgi:hypothetical protein